MNARGRAALAAMITVFALGLGLTVAQQEEGPILRPKKPAEKPAGATLLVMCDLACNWKLDGEAKGHIDAGGMAKVKVVPGQHVVVGATEDGLDQVHKICEAKASSQAVVSIELKPVRDARLKSEQEALERAGLIWIDPVTRLIWTKKDNGSDVDWQQATEYCKNLRLGGRSDWRLPAIDELQGIYDPNANVGGYHVKGNLQLSDWWEWSGSQGNGSGEAWYLNFFVWKRQTMPVAESSGKRALCVRVPTE